MQLRKDHIAGGVPLLAALGVLSLSRDLEIGTLASPGPGMLPHLAIGLIAVFSLVLLIGARASPPMADVEWSDLGHALRVTTAAVAAVALYEWLGFLLTMGLMMFALLVAAERAPPWRAAATSIGVTAGTYLLLAKLLKSPLPVGVLGF